MSVILDDAAPAALVADWTAAQAIAARAHATMTGAIIAAAADTSELALAARLGLSRATIRKALGK